MYPSSWVLDLKSDGKSQQSLTPATGEVPISFRVEAQKGNVQKSWVVSRGFSGRLRVGFDQAASGGSAVNWDRLFAAIAGVEVKSDVFGTMVTKEVSAGMILKHLIEYVANGYVYGDYARAQIASTDGDTAVDLYFTIPHTQNFLYRPQDTGIWLGWLANTEIKFYLNTTAALDAASTGAVLEATSNLQMWCDYDVMSDVDIPVLPYWALHTQNAGGNEIIIRGLGGEQGLKGVNGGDKGGFRLAGLFELMNVGGLGGATTSDNITELQAIQLGQDRFANIDALFYRYRKLTGRGAPRSSNGTSAAHDGAGNPELLSATPNATMNSATAMYVPIMAPSKGQQLTKLPKVYGDISLIQSYTSAVTSGQHKVASFGFYELSDAAKGDLMRRAGRPPQQYKLRKVFADDNAPDEVKELGKGVVNRARVLPDRIVSR